MTDQTPAEVYVMAARAGSVAGPPLPSGVSVELAADFAAAQPAFRAAVDAAYAAGLAAGKREMRRARRHTP